MFGGGPNNSALIFFKTTDGDWSESTDGDFFMKIIFMQPKLCLNSKRFHNGDITNPNIFEAVSATAWRDLGLLLHPNGALCDNS